MIRSRTRTTIWLGTAKSDPGWEIHTEDDMVMIETEDGNGNEIEVLISPALFPGIKKVIRSQERFERGDVTDAQRIADLKAEIEQAEAEIAEIRRENPDLLPERYRPRKKEMNPSVNHPDGPVFQGGETGLLAEDSRCFSGKSILLARGKPSGHRHELEERLGIFFLPEDVTHVFGEESIPFPLNLTRGKDGMKTSLSIASAGNAAHQLDRERIAGLEVGHAQLGISCRVTDLIEILASGNVHPPLVHLLLHHFSDRKGIALYLVKTLTGGGELDSEGISLIGPSAELVQLLRYLADPFHVSGVVGDFADGLLRRLLRSCQHSQVLANLPGLGNSIDTRAGIICWLTCYHIDNMIAFSGCDRPAWPSGNLAENAEIPKIALPQPVAQLTDRPFGVKAALGDLGDTACRKSVLLSRLAARHAVPEIGDDLLVPDSYLCIFGHDSKPKSPDQHWKW